MAPRRMNYITVRTIGQAQYVVFEDDVKTAQEVCLGGLVLRHRQGHPVPDLLMGIGSSRADGVPVPIGFLCSISGVSQTFPTESIKTNTPWKSDGAFAIYILRQHYYSRERDCELSRPSITSNKKGMMLALPQMSSSHHVPRTAHLR